MPIRSSAPRLTLALLLLLAAGCFSPGFLPPDVSLLKITPVKFELLSGEATIRLRFANPNRDPFTLEGIRLALSSHNESFAKGSAPSNQTIPAYGQIDLDVPVTISNLAALRVAGESAGEGQIAYALDVAFTLREEKGARHTLSARKEGTIPFSLPGLK